MFINQFQKILSYLKDVNEIGLYSTMVDSKWFIFFRNSSLLQVVLPFLAIILGLNTLLNIYQLKRAHNKNIEQWFNVMSSSIATILTCASFIGIFISILTGYSFVIGSWLFLSSLVILASYQITMLAINILRYHEIKVHKELKERYLQKIFNNIFVLALSMLSIGTALFVMVMPGAFPIIAGVFAVATLLMIGGGMIWRIMPEHWKQKITLFLKLNPGLETDLVNCFNQPCKTSSLENENSTYKFFSPPDCCAQIQKLDRLSAETLLLQIINNKIARLSNTPQSNSKVKDKIALLTELKNSLNGNLSKQQLIKKYPHAFQSIFWEKGEVEIITDAALQFNEELTTSKSSQPLSLASMYKSI